MNLVNEFRVSIAIEDPQSGGMTLLVAVEVPPNSINLDRAEDDEREPTRELLPTKLEGSLSCSMATWLRIKNEAMKQGAQWSQGITKTKTPNKFWSSKPKVTVIHVRHSGLLDAGDSAFQLVEGPNGQRLQGDIDDRVERVLVRDRRFTTAIEGL
jgi:hypothetical protein